MRPIISLSLDLLLSSSAFAGDWQPDPNRRYEIAAPIEQPMPASPSEDKWVEELLSKLRQSGATLNVVYR